MNNNPFDNYKGTSDSAVRGGLRELPMNWYKFLIYVALWFSAAVNILGAIPYFTGTSQTEEVLARFPILSTIDLFLRRSDARNGRFGNLYPLCACRI